MRDGLILIKRYMFYSLNAQLVIPYSTDPHWLPAAALPLSQAVTVTILSHPSRRSVPLAASVTAVSTQPDPVRQDLREDGAEEGAEGAVEDSAERHGEANCPAPTDRPKREWQARPTPPGNSTQRSVTLQGPQHEH